MNPSAILWLKRGNFQPLLLFEFTMHTMSIYSVSLISGHIDSSNGCLDNSLKIKSTSCQWSWWRWYFKFKPSIVIIQSKSIVVIISNRHHQFSDLTSSSIKVNFSSQVLTSFSFKASFLHQVFFDLGQFLISNPFLRPASCIKWFSI